MVRTLAIAFSLAVAALPATAAITFSGSPRKVLSETPDVSTGLNDLYILYSAAGVGASYTASSSTAPVTWYRYSTLGGGYAEEITSGISRDGSVSTLADVEGDMGYIVEEGTDRYYFWVVDYGLHRFSVSALNVAPDQECDMTALIPTGHGDRIVYTAINGRQVDLDRDIKVTYNTLSYTEDTHLYQMTPAAETLPYLQETIHVHAPLCNTSFLIEGDKFLKEWGETAKAESPMFNTIAVACETWAEAAEREVENEQKGSGDSDSGSLGGSAPCEITFSAAITDGVVFTEWQMAKDEEFTNIEDRVSQTEFTYTFVDEGTTFVRFVAANSAGTCDAYGPTYSVYIGESDLKCPNAFSPGASEGVNDEWRVSYRSIVSFECHIFNRLGQKMASLTDPSQGWDGKYRGKLVPAGVYYYVITAKGADGKDYKLSGDINIINYK